MYPEVTTHGTKGGLHQVRNGPAIPLLQMAHGRGAQLSIKGVDNLGLAIDAKKISPDILTIGRITHPELEAAPGMDSLPTDDQLFDMAHAMIINILNRSSPEERDATDVWEVWNEPRPHTVSGYRKLADLMMHTIVIAANYGLRVGLFSFNSGTPEWDEMLTILSSGVMQLAYNNRSIVCLHEGLVGLPPDISVDYGFGTMAIRNPYTGAVSPVFADAGPWLFRYRFWLHAALDLRIVLPPFVISEWGCVPQGYLASMPAEEVMRRYVWYDDEASRDPIMIRFKPFSIGSDWPGEQWEPYYGPIIDHSATIQNRINVARQPLPPPDQPPKPDFVTVRVNAARKWNLRTGPGTHFPRGGAVSSGTRYPALEAVWGNTWGHREAWYMVHPQGFAPEFTVPLWIASSATE